MAFMPMTGEIPKLGNMKFKNLQPAELLDNYFFSFQQQ